MQEPKLISQWGLGYRVYEDGKVQIWNIHESVLPGPDTQPVPTTPAPTAAVIQKPKERYNPVKTDPSYQKSGRMVIVDGSEYRSIQEACRQFGLRPWEVKDRCASSMWPNWVMPL